jgi:hypothetical protein
VKLGILGTMVWDRIHARDARPAPFEEWGGITYALAAADAARPEGCTLVPILKVGADLQTPAFEFLHSLSAVDKETGIRVVDQPNNRVELHYQDNVRRCERLTGGVPGWTWLELAPILDGVDALYINFISGFELVLSEALQLRLGYHGPMYADLHSLLLGLDAGGLRTPRPLASWREWLRCFDVVQLNETELETLAQSWGDPWRFASDVVNDELKLLLVTLAERGAAYVASPAFRSEPMSWRPRGLVKPGLRAGGDAVSRRIPPDSGPLNGDPTGCGDVWGATMFCRLLAGDPLDRALEVANQAAGRNVLHRGATGLNHYLRGRLGP